MHRKIGRTLSTMHEVHVIGFGSQSFNDDHLFQHPVGEFPRISLSRLLAPWRILNFILKLRPDLLIVCTHELLWQGLIARLLLKCRLWYDVQENYHRNIRFSNAFPPVLRSFIAGYVRLKERIAAPLIERFLLAEQSYEQELPFARARGVVIGNKVSRDDIPLMVRPRDLRKGPLKLVFTGTLSELTGVFIAIDVAAALHDIHPVRLTIAGFCPQASERAKLMERCRALDFVSLKTADAPVSHREIMAAIAEADVGIVSYPRNPATWDCMPTKLYEYMASRLPLILIDNPRWVKLAASFAAAVVFDPADFDPVAMLESLRSGKFYTSDPEDVYWDSEAEKLRNIL
jgi:glycosyltransferase involved in cell wall biosynthesis